MNDRKRKLMWKSIRREIAREEAQRLNQKIKDGQIQVVAEMPREWDPATWLPSLDSLGLPLFF